MMCAIFLSHFVFAVFWRTLVAFGFVFHHDWFCRLYIIKRLFMQIYSHLEYLLVGSQADGVLGVYGFSHLEERSPIVSYRTENERQKAFPCTKRLP